MSVEEKNTSRNLTGYDQFLMSSSPDLVYYDKIRQTDMVGFPSESTRSFPKKIRSDSGRQDSESIRSSSSGFRRIPMNSDSIRRWIRSDILGIESQKARPGYLSIYLSTYLPTDLCILATEQCILINCLVREENRVIISLKYVMYCHF